MSYDYLEKLNQFAPEIIRDFRKTHKSSALPAEMQQFIIEIETVLEIREDIKTDNISRIAKELNKRFPQMHFDTARSRVYNSINFFHVNSNVSNKAWDSLYADKYEDLAKVSLAKGNEITAKLCYDKAYELRTRSESGFTSEDFKKPIFIITNRLVAEEIGFGKKNLKEIARKAQDGQYISLIKGLEISKEDKETLLNDAGLFNEAEILDENDDTAE